MSAILDALRDAVTRLILGPYKERRWVIVRDEEGRPHLEEDEA